MYSRIIQLIIFLFFITLDCSAQMRKFEVELYTKKVRPLKLDISCEDILDLRSNMDSTWQVSKSMNNVRADVILYLKGDFKPTLKNHLNSVILEQGGSEKYVFVLREFKIYENVAFNTREKVCNIEIEFIKREGNTYTSYGSYNSTIIEGGLASVKSHLKNINTALQNCIVKFIKARARGEIGEQVNLTDLSVYTYDYERAPPQGHYKSFQSLRVGEPDSNFEIHFKKTSSGLLSNYRLKPVNGVHKKTKDLFISNGKDLFLNASSYSDENHYTKAKHYGKYIFFEDRIANPNVAIAFGLTGAALSNKIRAIVLDTTNGKIVMLNAKSLIPYIKDHEQILKAFYTSKRNHEDIEQAIIDLNAEAIK